MPGFAGRGLKYSENPVRELLITFGILAAIVSAIALAVYYFAEPFLGAPKELFYLEGNPPKLVAVLSRSWDKGQSAAVHLKTFNLETREGGEPLLLTDEASYDHYRIRRDTAVTAWGQSKPTGFQYLDLAAPRILNDAVPVEKMPSLVPLYPDPSPSKWPFSRIPGTVGYAATAPGTAPDSNAFLLLSPRLLPELNPNIKNYEKRWVLHKRRVNDERLGVLSYLNAGGDKLGQLDLATLYGEGYDLSDISVSAVLTLESSVQIFTAVDEHARRFDNGAVLKAFVTDPETGELLETVYY